MSQERKVTVTNVCQILLRKGLISEEQSKMVLARTEAQTTRLYSHQQSGYSKRFSQGVEQISPAEVIASFNLEVPAITG